MTPHPGGPEGKVLPCPKCGAPCEATDHEVAGPLGQSWIETRYTYRRPSPASGAEPLTAENVREAWGAVAYGDDYMQMETADNLARFLNARRSRSPAPAVSDPPIFTADSGVTVGTRTDAPHSTGFTATPAPAGGTAPGYDCIAAKLDEDFPAFLPPSPGGEG